MKVALWIRFVVVISALGVALVFFGWSTSRRVQRPEYVSALPGRAETPDRLTDASPTGYANGQRELVVGERNEPSFGWIAVTQRALQQGTWRVRRVDSENAPVGRDEYSTSPYRWWLVFLTKLQHAATGQPMGRATEQAALYADPLLFGLFLVGATLFVAWRFGVVAAGFLSFGMVALFPFAAGFLPGAPDHRSLARLCALAASLALLAGVRTRGRPERWHALAGVMGGFGLWVDVTTLAPLLAGTFLGALATVGLERWRSRNAVGQTATTEHWRIWGLSGAVTVLLGYLLEYAPEYLGSWRFQHVHPLYGVAWLGAGELLHLASAQGDGEANQKRRNFRHLTIGSIATLAVLCVPFALKWWSADSVFTRDAYSFHLTLQPSGIVSANTVAWIARDGVSGAVVATLLPFLLLVPVGGLFWRRATKPEDRLGIAVAVGPLLVAIGLASVQLAWWVPAGGLLLVAIVSAISVNGPDELPFSPRIAPLGPEEKKSTRLTGGPTSTGPIIDPRSDAYSRKGDILGAAAIVLMLFVPGLLQMRPEKKPDASLPLTSAETQELIERHLAHWLAKHSGEPGAIVYAPPHTTTSLAYFGGLRGIGTFAPENRSGFGVSLMIAAANTVEEAQALLQSRGVRYVVVPSWDPFFDNFAELYLDKRFAGRTSFLVGNLRRFQPPAWLRPLAYQMPEVKGFEGQSVLVFEMVENQSPALAEARLVEYLLETGRMDQALSANEALRRFPGDVGALAARAQVAAAREDARAFGQAIDLIVERLENGGDRYLAWDRRLSLAIVLAQANKLELAQAQVKTCIDQATTEKLRSLSSSSLFRFLVLRDAMALPFSDNTLQHFAVDLLPNELRARL